MKKIHDSYAKLVELKWMGRALTLSEALMRPGAGLAPAPAPTRLSGRRCWRPLGLGRARGAGAHWSWGRWSWGDVGAGAPWEFLSWRGRWRRLALAAPGRGRASALVPAGADWTWAGLGAGTH